MLREEHPLAAEGRRDISASEAGTRNFQLSFSKRPGNNTVLTLWRSFQMILYNPAGLSH